MYTKIIIPILSLIYVSNAVAQQKQTASPTMLFEKQVDDCNTVIFYNNGTWKNKKMPLGKTTLSVSGEITLDGNGKWKFIPNTSENVLSACQTVGIASNGTYSIKQKPSTMMSVFHEGYTYEISTNGAYSKKQFADPFDEQMVHVQGGTFQMGTDADADYSEKPAHSVTLSDFYIGKYEVTQKLWKQVMGNNPPYFKDCDQCPVEFVNWNDVQDFLKKLNAQAGRNYRLPTEAEWEYSARQSGQKVMFGNGKNILDPVEANYNADFINSSGYKPNFINNGINRNKPMPVGSFAPNSLGLYDMSGNVAEMCSDWYDSYSSNNQTNPIGPDSGNCHVIRGGQYDSGGKNCTNTFRSCQNPNEYNQGCGFRLARSF